MKAIGWGAGLILLLAGAARAQTPATWGLEYQPLAKVTHGTETLALPWAGGLNAPQFSNIDLNQDGRPDLFAFDRLTSRVSTYLAATDAANQPYWQYAPQYEALFPQSLSNWVLLRDYDCDGRPDLFTLANGGDIQVYHQETGPTGQLQFTLVSKQLQYANSETNRGNIFAGANDVPAIDDVDGDGKLDLLLVDFASESSLVWYRNVSPACGGLSFRLESNYWGRLGICLGGCTGFAFDASCRAAAPLHTGGLGLTTFDLDGDGDQDLLTGRDQCPELISLRNDGTAAQALMTAAGQNTAFPAGATPVRLPSFPGAYFVDVTFDGRPDLLVTPTLLENEHGVGLRQSVWRYDNTGTTKSPAFTFRQPDFLQGQMLDVSEGAAPALADLTADGLPDLLIASGREPGSHHASYAALHYYRNTGTATTPAFSRETTDYLGLAAQGFEEVKPVLVDLNHDGAVDLAFGAQLAGRSSLWYLLNQAPAGQPARFNASLLQEASGLGNLPGLAPAFADLDGDQYPDLVLGTNDIAGAGVLRHYRQVPGGAALAFTLVSDDYGQVRTADNERPLNLSPLLLDLDQDGRLDLLTSDHTGTIRFFGDVKSQSGAFSSRENLFYQPLTNQYGGPRLGRYLGQALALAAADLTADGQPELLVGMPEGGVRSYQVRRTVTTAVRPPAALAELTVYPVPASGQASVTSLVPVRVQLLDATGRVVRPLTGLARTHQVLLSGLAPGLYLVRAQDVQGHAATRRLVVR